MRTFSFGGGVQSVAALVLCATGRVQYDHFLFSNVGEDSENPGTLNYFRYVVGPYALMHDISMSEIRRVWKDGRTTTLYQAEMEDEGSVHIPAFLKGGGPGRRNCTGDWKIKVIAKWLKEHGATAENPAITGLGISTDEFQRMRTDSGIAWQVLEYPLIDLSLSRKDCVKIIEGAGLPVPPKSACFFCPFKKRGEWIDLRRTQPDLFEKAVALENRINEKRRAMGKDDMYLHSGQSPLEQAVGLQFSLFEDDACESGYCMT